MSVIAVVNQKGGVGKTTTVVSLAGHLRRRGQKVLIVDFDVQGHAATSLGVSKGDGLFRLLVQEAPVGEVAVQAREGIDLVTSNKSTEKIKAFLSDQAFRELYIAQVLGAAVGGYDTVILDLAPGSDLLHVGALIAADYFLIPAKLDFLALDGVMEVLGTVRSLGRIPNVAAPMLLGVVPTLYDRTTAETVENLKRLVEAVHEDVVLPPIPMDTRAREAVSRGLMIWEYAPDTAAAVGYPVMGGQAGRNSRGQLGGYLHLGEIVERMVV